MKGLEVSLNDHISLAAFESNGVVSAIIKIEEGRFFFKLSGMDAEYNSYTWINTELSVNEEINIKVKDMDKCSDFISTATYEDISDQDKTQNIIKYFIELERMLKLKGLL